MDTVDTLSRVMRNGLPDPERVAEVASELDQYRRAVSVGPQSRLTLFGDVASSLIANGNSAAAIELESQWNSVTHLLTCSHCCQEPSERGKNILP